jgi:uncharacterized protein (DUF1684 family)
MEHRIEPSLNNPQWPYIRSEETNIKLRFEDFGFRYKDVLYGKKFDFTGLDYWVYQITHREENSHG